MTTLTGTQGWADERTQHVAAVKPRRSALALMGGLVSAARARLAGRLSDAADLAGLGLLTVGAAHLPGTWGEVGVWVAGGLSLLITSAKLNA